MVGVVGEPSLVLSISCLARLMTPSLSLSQGCPSASAVEIRSLELRVRSLRIRSLAGQIQFATRERGRERGRGRERATAVGLFRIA